MEIYILKPGTVYSPHCSTAWILQKHITVEEAIRKFSGHTTFQLIWSENDAQFFMIFPSSGDFNRFVEQTSERITQLLKQQLSR